MAFIVRYNWDRQFFVRHELNSKKQVIIANSRIKRPAGLSSLRDIASNPTTYDILFITDCKSAYYLEILTMLGGAMYVADILFFHRDSIWSHRALCVKQLMVKSRRAIYRCTAQHIIQKTVPM
jgi:hypothetical protein